MRSPRRLRRILIFLTLAALGAAVPVVISGSAPEASAAIGGMTWSDEFNAASGAGVDTNKWKFDIGGGGWGNNERQYYTNSTRNAVHDGAGNLVITARKENPSNYQCHYGTCEYTSARLLTAGKFTQKYGRFEARIKIPRGQGIWPAFWMLGDDIGTNPWPNSGEIDIMENVGYEPNTVHGTIHGPGYSGGEGIGGAYSIGSPFADGFHTFAVNWEPSAITWFVDGNQYLRKTTADLGGDRWVFDHPFFMLLNVAVGGNWPGYPDATTQFPQTMTIDYVRVYSYTDGGGGTTRTGQITGMDGKCIGLANGNTADSTPIDVYSCVGDATQRWTIQGDGTIRNSGKCLDVRSAGTADGTPVQIYTCNGTAAQQWVYSTGRDLVNPQANKCLDMKGNTSADFTQLIIWTCTGGANQKWNLPA